MKINKLYLSLLLVIFAVAASSCSDKESYSDLLNSERDAVNAYLSTQRVVNNIPADTVFETGPDAPFYRIDPDGNVYMQVIKAGSKTNKAKTSQKIYFRYSRYNLQYWYKYNEWVAEGNSTEMSLASSYFLYADFSLQLSSQWGSGIQLPLSLLGIDSEVNEIIKSQYGQTSEISQVQPYLYHLRYFPNKL